MIKNKKGEKCSPKDLAKEVLVDAVLNIGSVEGDEGRTEKEDALIDEQFKKLSQRVLKVLGYVSTQDE
jgi:hypothetical protein